jgi:hypothetical protein
MSCETSLPLGDQLTVVTSPGPTSSEEFELVESLSDCRHTAPCSRASKSIIAVHFPRGGGPDELLRPGANYRNLHVVGIIAVSRHVGYELCPGRTLSQFGPGLPIAILTRRLDSLVSLDVERRNLVRERDT